MSKMYFLQSIQLYSQLQLELHNNGIMTLIVIWLLSVGGCQQSVCMVSNILRRHTTQKGWVDLNTTMSATELINLHH